MHREHHGKPSDVLVWQAPSRAMNPTIPARVVEQAYADDPASAAAEWGGCFRADVETFLAREAVEACIPLDCRERPPLAGLRYVAFCDPSGGSADSMTLALAHREDGSNGAPARAVLDLVREARPPFSPEAVVADFAEVLRAYGVGTVEGDRYAGEWPRERFAVHGIDYRPAAKSKSELYRDLLPLVNGGRAELLDVPRLVAQLAGLERRTTRGGRDSIDHGPGAHDDVGNAAAGALVLAAGGRAPGDLGITIGDASAFGQEPLERGLEAHRRREQEERDRRLLAEAQAAPRRALRGALERAGTPETSLLEELGYGMTEPSKEEDHADT
jgi:hypothetical protein